MLDEVEAAGGMTQYVASGEPKAQIERAAAAKQASVDRGETVIVGVNKYRRDKEDEIDTLDVDNHAVRRSQIARLEEVRANRDDFACKAALDALARGAAQKQGNLLALAVEAARHDATLGEISEAMEDAFGRYDTLPTPVKGVYAEAYADDDRYAQVVEDVKAVERARPQAQADGRQDGAGRRDRGANVIASACRYGLRSAQRPAVPDAAGNPRHGACWTSTIGMSSLAAGQDAHPRTDRPAERVRTSRHQGDRRGRDPAEGLRLPARCGRAGHLRPGLNVVECAADVLRLPATACRLPVRIWTRRRVSRRRTIQIAFVVLGLA